MPLVNGSTESYVAGVFARLDQAQAARNALTALAREGRLVVYGCGIFRRGAAGDVEALESTGVPGDNDREAIDELNERLPDGYCALLAHVREADPSLVDGAMTSAGGNVFRRSLDRIQEAGFRRFLDSTSLE